MVNIDNKTDELRKRIKKIIKEYDNQGIHRTGTKVDDNSAEWLVDEIKKIGLTPELEKFSFNRIDIEKSILEIKNKIIDGLPFFDCTLRDEVYIKGKLGSIKNENTIGITQANNDTIRRLDRLRRRKKNPGLILVTEGNTPGLSLINAEHFQEPFGPPVLQISSENWPWLNSNLGNEAILNFKINRVNSNAFNVVSRVRGKDSSLNPMVIMTPRSGWWNCASERAGGIAILLEIMLNFYSNTPSRDIIFLLTSGHELGHLGLNNYLKKNSNLSSNASCFIHLGANLSAVSQIDENNLLVPSLLIQSSNSEIESLALNVFKQLQIVPKWIIPPERRPWGEAKNIYDGGGQYFSIIDTYNKFFHHPHDRFHSAVDIDKMVIIARALIILSSKLTNLN